MPEHPLLSVAGAAEEPPAGAVLERARGLAQLAFGSLTQVDEFSRTRHLALLHTESLELDLNDPAQRCFGDYELLELLGEGGMGVVYRAHQISLEREVAVKLLSAGPWASHDFIARFEREAQNAARMQHPNIVTVHEVGSFEGLQFFSMRLVRGQSLAELLRADGPLDAMRAARLMRTVAEALAYAHSLDVLHLDLKPGNVLLDEGGVPHVADFGLARRLESALALDNEEVSGTPAYMAPEQAQARQHKLSAATDIWGLGAVLYELVTGHPPFRAANAQDTLKLVVEGTVRAPRRWQPLLPLDLEAIVLKCLAHEPAGRYADARALADDLGRFIEHRAVLARPLHIPQRFARWVQREPRLAIASALGIAALLIGLAATTQEWRRAESNAATASERLWESRRDTALRMQLDGDGFKALPGLIANIDEQKRAGAVAHDDIERREVGAILNQGVVLLNRVRTTDAIHASPFAAELSPDGSRFALAMTDLTVRWFDTRTMKQLGHVDLLGLPVSTGQPEAPVLLRFIDNHYLRVTLDWVAFYPAPAENDTYLIDLDAGRVVDFPDSFVDLSNGIFDADGKFALLNDSKGHTQLWQVRPWKALSPLIDLGKSMEHLVLGRNGKYVIRIDNAQHALFLYDPRTLAHPERIALPIAEGVSAWAESGNGRYLALGDFQGSVFLLDLATKAVRHLETPPGREVTWIAFSEDDAWLSAVRWDGAIYAFDVASGNPLNAGMMHQDFELRHVAINHRQRLLIASGLGKSSLWRLPQPGATGVEASRVLTSPMRPAVAGPYSLGFSDQTGLLITAETDGEVRLWQAPATPVLSARSARQVPGNLEYDGGHVVDVQYNKLRIAPTGRGRPSAWIEFPQPVGFAELMDDSHTLVVTAGIQLSVFDVATMRPRFAPINLDDSPMRLATTASSGIVALSFPIRAKVGFAERIESYDLKSGRRCAVSLILPGPLHQFELSPQGARLLAVGPANGSTQVFDARTLRRIGAYRHDPDAPVIWASFRSGTDSLFLLARPDDPRLLSSRLMSWNLAPDTISDVREFNGAWTAGVIAVAGKAFVAGREMDFLDPGGAHAQRIPAPTRDEVTAVLAVSHGGRLIAHAFRYGVQIYEAADGAPVGPMLHADLLPIDVIAQLAFSPDDGQLLARTLQGRWVRWRLMKDTRAVASLRHDSDLLNALANNSTQAPTLIARPSDAGIWRAPTPRPPIAAATYINGAPIPLRTTSGNPLLLDMTSVYNTAPGSLFNLMRAVIPTMDFLPLGTVRIDGVDYDVRGVTQLQPVATPETSIDFPQRVTGIRVPTLPIAAFHILLLAGNTAPGSTQDTQAQLRVHYRDGSVALLPMRRGQDLPNDSGEQEAVPLAWAHGDMMRLMGYRQQVFLSNPRLPNPHPERLISSIDLEAVGAASSPAIFAVTAEPVIAQAISGIHSSTIPNFIQPKIHAGGTP